MDTDLKCNRLTCRKSLTDKAVVTTCSHIFCVECANELFNAARLCPACDTSLTEPDDIVVCSLHPSNDYKTSVLSGLTPSIILEICTRAISFWQYQIFQENSFQQAVVRNINDKNAQLQKQLENVVREANGEISLLNNKAGELERDLELERRKNRELQDTSREREKEYQKLKLLHDKLKRKALLVMGPIGQDGLHNVNGGPQGHLNEDHSANHRGFGANIGNNVNLGAVVGGMEANAIQRTPIGSRTINGQFLQQGGWPQQPSQVQQPLIQTRTRNHSHRQPFAAPTDHSYRSGHTSDRSESANEVENMLVNPSGNRSIANTSWIPPSNAQTRQHHQDQGFPQQPTRRTSKFRPAGGMPIGR